jgi:hypothetical protein
MQTADLHRAQPDHLEIPAIDQSHADLVARIAAAAVPPIAIYPFPEDFTRRGLTATLILSAVKEHLTAMVTEAQQHDAGNSIKDAELIETIDAHLSDLAGDIAGAFNAAAERVIEDRYDGCARGPMYRRRS